MSSMLRACALVLVVLSPVLAQTVAGTISGSVVDTAGLSVPNAPVSLTNEETGDVRASQTNEAGDFIFNSVLPGRYTVTVTAPGFKKFEQKSLNLTAQERLSTGKLKLEVGSVAESITVSSSGTAIQLEETDRSALLTSDQMANLMSKGRNFVALLNMLPGAVGDERYFEKDDFSASLTPNFSGVPSTFNSITVDGLSSHDVANPHFIVAVVNMDAIAEVKVLLNNYKAEYGRNGAAVITSVTKSGTKDLHGTTYYYQRNEALNANQFFNNANLLRRPVYRFNTGGFTIGGPVFIPGKFNSQRNKLFFFLSMDRNATIQPQSLVQYTFPTALERAGDYSQTLDQNDKLVPIWDPLNNRVPFANNVVPTNRIDVNGQKFLSFFPTPNYFNRAVSRGNYNYNFQESIDQSSRQEVIRVDYNISSKVRVYFRGATWVMKRQGYNVYPGMTTWPLVKSKYQETNPSGVFSLNYMLSPSLIFDSSFGMHRRTERVMAPGDDAFSALDRYKLGINIPQIYPAVNPYHILPFASFGGVPGAASLSLNSDYPQTKSQPVIPLNASITKVKGPHAFKAGLYVEQSRAFKTSSATFAGQFAFARDTNNPMDTNWAYSNLLTGTYQSYTESDTRPNYDLRGVNFEWYLQDTWKATRRLTLDFGVRFSYFTPFAQANNIGANWQPNLWDPKKKVLLYQPVLNAQNQRVAMNPLTGQIGVAALIGAIVPNSGNLYNGIAFQSDPGVPRGFVANTGIHPGPRMGFAWDVFGNGKTALRGGIGITYQSRPAVPQQIVDNVQVKPTIFNGTFATFDPKTGVYFPRSLNSLNPMAKAPQVFNFSFGVQRSLGWDTAVDIGYVGTQVRQLPMTQQLNTLPYGARFLPQNIDPTTKRVYSDDYLRPYIGFTNLAVPRTVSSNYHGLQSQLNRRFSHGLQFGVSYTWSKSMGFTGTFPTYLNNQLNYGKNSLDRTHLFSMNYMYDVPKLSRIVNLRPVKWAFDGWQLSGTVMLQSGRPWAVSYSKTYSLDENGGGDWTRVNVLAKATLDHGERTFHRFFNPDVFAPPLSGDIGNAPQDVFRGPGRTNWDTSLFKVFKVHEKKTLQFRWEFYNVLNHASFNNIDNAARFDQTGKQVNARFGELISNGSNNLPPRYMQGSLRFTF